MNEDQTTIEQTVEPKAGRVVVFTSGKENPHVVDRVLTGNRFVLAFWFTCNPARKFENFLDGKEHTTFSLNYADSLKQKDRQEKRKRMEENKAKRDIENAEKGLDEL
jgi:2OG-Fe(II) oxygenase superfamily